MADNAWLTYQLSQTESTVWQQGGPAALALQQQLAEIHRQGGLGFASFLRWCTLTAFSPHSTPRRARCRRRSHRRESKPTR